MSTPFELEPARLLHQHLTPGALDQESTSANCLWANFQQLKFTPSIPQAPIGHVAAHSQPQSILSDTASQLGW